VMWEGFGILRMERRPGYPQNVCMLTIGDAA
jgi:hypothetical protein